MPSKKINNKIINYKLCFSACGLLLVWFIIIFLIITPALNRLKQKSNLLKTKTVEEREKEDKIKQFPLLKKQFQEFNEEKKHLNGVLFNEGDIIRLVRELEEIAIDTNNNIDIQVENREDQVKPSVKNKKKDKEDKKEEKLMAEFVTDDYFVVNIDLSGDYNAFLKFVYKLQNIPHYNNVIGFELTKQEDDEKNKTNSRYQQSNSIFFAVNDKNDDENKEVLAGEKISLRSKIKAVFYLKK